MNHQPMNHQSDPRALTALITATFACVILVTAFGIMKLTGTLDPLVARRGVGAMLGLILIITGNFVPKLRLFQSATGAANSEAIERFSGWTFVICGLAFGAAFLFVPADKVFIVPPLIVLVGFLAVLTRWLMWKAKCPGPLLLPMTHARLALATLLLTVLTTSAIFLADAVWGNEVSRWMAILFPFILICFSAIRGRKPANA